MSNDTQARQAIEAVERSLESGDRSRARSGLDLAEMEIELLGGAAAVTLRPQLEVLRLRVAGAGRQVDAKAREGAMSSIDRRIENAKMRISGGNPAPDELADADDYMGEVSEHLTEADQAEYRRQLAVLRKMSDRHVATKALEEAKNYFAEFRTYHRDAMAVTAGKGPGNSDFVISNLYDVSARVRRSAAQAAGAPEAAAMVAEVDAGMKTFGEAWARSQLAEVLEDLRGARARLDSETSGWKEEQGNMTLAQMLNGSVDGDQQLGMPATFRAITRIADWLHGFRRNTSWEQGLSQPPIAAIRDEVVAKRAELCTRLETVAVRLVTEIESATVTDDNRSRLMRFSEDDLPSSIGGSSQLIALQDRVRAVVRAYDEAQRGKIEAAQAREEELTRMADDRWSAIVDGLSPERFEVQSWRGQIGMTVQTKVQANLFGWDYQGEGVDIAFRSQGVPCFGTFDPVLREGIRSVLASVLRRNLPDVEMRVIAEVTGSGRMEQIIRTRKVIHNPHGPDIIEELTSTEPVEAVALRIIALRCGPVAMRVP